MVTSISKLGHFINGEEMQTTLEQPILLKYL
jgi:hypothetical protein